MNKFLIGIDVSKNKLDACVINQSKVVEETIIGNQIILIKSFFKKFQRDNQIDCSAILVCAEYTGQYTYPLCCACKELKIDLWLENPSQIKYRSGIKRGKNDKLDAHKIAIYAQRFIDEIRLYDLPDKALGSLKQLISERDLYVSDRAKYQGQLTDQKRFMDKNDFKQKQKRLQMLICELNKAITQIEKEIQQNIDSDETLANQNKLLCSIEGIGERTAIKMIVETNAFRDFSNPRKFCCHAGVAPFSYSSGSSQRSKNKVSGRADKSIKTLLHMSALIASTRMKGELHEYYKRKVEEGKNKMSVINAVRAKLVYRMFAVIKKNEIYQKNYLNALA